MIPRQAKATLDRLAKGFPIILLTGPRQSGKTTLARACFAHKPYVSLENPEVHNFAQSDPKRFFAQFPEGTIIDEIQRQPELLSWLQTLVDERQRMGDFVITGSAQFDLMAGVTQSLAGRVGRVELLPLSAVELGETRLHHDLNQTLLTGGYPALFDRALAPSDWFPNYVATYIERDVRQLVVVRDLNLFQRFLRLCAARSGQLINLASLGAEAGISAVTARQWLGVLETSYIAMRLQPYHRNFGKRLVKTPKLYFLDTGLMAWLLGIRDADTLKLHPARGAIFESWVISEKIKQHFNAGQAFDHYFWRDNTGHEVDLVVEQELALHAIEIKSGATFAPDWVHGAQRLNQLAKTSEPSPTIIYGGDGLYQRQGCDVLGWRAFGLGLDRPPKT